MGMRGAVTQENLPDPRRSNKLRLMEKAIKEQDLSWQIKTRFGEDRWSLLVYDLQWREWMPGALIIVDRDTDMDVKIYPDRMWFSVDTVRRMSDGEWEEFIPHAVYLADLADRLIDDAEQERLNL